MENHADAQIAFSESRGVLRHPDCVGMPLSKFVDDT
jgi:hypothetical protein